MHNRKKQWIFLGAGLLVVIFSCIWFLWLPSHPSSLPSRQAMLEKLREHSFGVEAREIVDVISLDDRHAYAPYISNGGSYGQSFWTWDRTQWKVGAILEKGEPYIWKLDGEFSKQYIVYHVDPRDEIGTMKYHLIRERYYQISGGLQRYTPRVQMSLSIPIQEERRYDAIPLPDDWIRMMEEEVQISGSGQSSDLFGWMSASSQLRIGWNTYDRQGKKTFTEHSVNGSSYGNGELALRFISILNESELEDGRNP
ncbi:hypothetical protein NQ117_07415 [Paenibacillus sp. SC116]|uniref:hypothetical protein n=1 Tax=Paenibacillus sp. SC116 TaxID=2968986 RepID=UPI00215B2BB9|nr:hypothetical protein [Paenibacillus sp. SC116]MCR8843509.1 hypothetical protein [Paenibacillus sp. SC116]